MAMTSWSNTYPATGLLKSNKLSEKLRVASLVRTRFAQLAVPEPGYGKKMGESITITRFANLSIPTTSVIEELSDVPTDTISFSTQAITVLERGRAIPMTNFAKHLSTFDLQDKVQKLLMNQLKISLDIDAATAAKAGQVVAIPDGASSLTFETDGDPTATATVNANLYHMEQLRDYMHTILNVEPYDGENYIGVADTKFIRGVKSDSRWENWKVYTSSEEKASFEIGRIENIRLVESNNRNALSGTKGTGSVLGEAVIMGDDCLVSVIAQDPQIVVDAGRNFNRFQQVAWLGIYSYAQVWSDSGNAGQARSVYVTSA